MDIVLTFIFILLAGLIFNHFLKFPFEYYFFIVSILFALKYIRIEQVPESDSNSEKQVTSYNTCSNFPIEYYDPNK
jgi:Na+/citrate or Na+/malate symporter